MAKSKSTYLNLDDRCQMAESIFNELLARHVMTADGGEYNSIARSRHMGLAKLNLPPTWMVKMAETAADKADREYGWADEEFCTLPINFEHLRTFAGEGYADEVVTYAVQLSEQRELEGLKPFWRRNHGNVVNFATAKRRLRPVAA